MGAYTTMAQRKASRTAIESLEASLELVLDESARRTLVLEAILPMTDYKDWHKQELDSLGELLGLQAGLKRKVLLAEISAYLGHTMPATESDVDEETDKGESKDADAATSLPAPSLSSPAAQGASQTATQASASLTGFSQAATTADIAAIRAEMDAFRRVVEQALLGNASMAPLVPQEDLSNTAVDQNVVAEVDGIEAIHNPRSVASTLKSRISPPTSSAAGKPVPSVSARQVQPVSRAFAVPEQSEDGSQMGNDKAREKKPDRRLVGDSVMYPVATRAEEAIANGRHPSVFAWVMASGFEQKRNRREALTLAHILDAMKSGNIKHAAAVGYSRLASLKVADKSGNWQVATQLEVIPEHEDLDIVDSATIAEAERRVKISEKVYRDKGKKSREYVKSKTVESSSSSEDEMERSVQDTKTTYKRKPHPKAKPDRL
jgi:hypothetical protein